MAQAKFSLLQQIETEFEPVQTAHHGNWSWQKASDVAFAKALRTAPIVANEIHATAVALPIFFERSINGVMPVALLKTGHENANAITQDNRWAAAYVPASLRLYPFAPAPNAVSRPTVVHTTGSRCFDRPTGARFFDPTGQETPEFAKIRALIETYSGQWEQTQSICGSLAEHALLTEATTLPAWSDFDLGAVDVAC